MCSLYSAERRRSATSSISLRSARYRNEISNDGSLRLADERATLGGRAARSFLLAAPDRVCAPHRFICPLGAGAEKQLDLLLLIPPGRPVGDRLLLRRPPPAAPWRAAGDRRAVRAPRRPSAPTPVAATVQGLGAALRRKPADDDQNALVLRSSLLRGWDSGDRSAAWVGRGKAGAVPRAPSCKRSSCRPRERPRLSPPESTR